MTPSEIQFHAKRELTWFDRALTFRKALRAMSAMPGPEDELLVFLMTARLLGTPHLFALTTEGIWAFGPFSRIEPFGWRGIDVLMLTVHENRSVRINLQPGVVPADRPAYVEITPSLPQQANSFINLANLLCLHQLWGDAQGFALQLDTTINDVMNYRQP